MWKRSFIQVIIIFLLIIISISSINFFVDPYSIFRTVGDYSKNEIGSHLRLFKSIAIRHQKDEILLFGDSEIEQGINAERLSQICNKKVFNASFSSMQIYELRRFLETAVKYNKPELVVVGLQMYDFGSMKFADDYQEEYLTNDFNPYTKLLSVDTFKSSIAVVKDIMNNKTSERNKFGLWTPQSNEPYEEKFLANERHYINDNAPKLNNFKYKDNESTFDNYEKVLRLCYDNDIALVIFISPSHARLYEAIATGNGWDIFEKWKKQLVIRNEDLALQKNKDAFAIWDFSGFHELNSEKIPSNGKNEKMKYYYESSHYTPILGDIVLNRMFAVKSSTDQNYPDFGVKLTSKNIESHLIKQRIDREKWCNSHPVDVQEIYELQSNK